MKTLFPNVTVDPKVQFGKPVIAGTRVPVEVVVGHIAGGDMIETVMRAYKLEREQVLSALQYAAKIVAEERVFAPKEHAFSH